MAAGLAFTLICVLLMAGIVAASGPGDLAYGLRIAAEQIPARLTPGAEARARAELKIASHRLAELDRTMSSQDQALDERTVSALVADVEMAAETAASLPELERIEIAARIAERAQDNHPTCGVQRAVHSTPKPFGLPPCAPIAPPNASGQGRCHLHHRRPDYSANRQEPPPRRRTAPQRPSGRRHRTLLPPRPRRLRLRLRLRPPAIAQHRTMPAISRRRLSARPTATAGRSTPEATPSGRGPTATAPRPGLTATSPGSGPVATPSGPGPAATSPGPGPESPPGGRAGHAASRSSKRPISTRPTST